MTFLGGAYLARIGKIDLAMDVLQDVHGADARDILALPSRSAQHRAQASPAPIY